MKTQQLDAVLLELDEAGSFIGYASVYDVVDSAGDVIVHGALANTECPLPLLYGHVNHDSPIGQVVACLDDEYGLLIEGRIDLHSEKGRAVYSLMKKGTLHALSIGFYANKSRNNAHGGFDIFDASLCEVSIVLVPANEQAQILKVKSAQAELETSELETSELETSEPETSEPETSEPETSEPETSEPETSEPETSEPETSEPETETSTAQAEEHTRDYAIEAKSRIAIAIQKYSKR